MAQPGGLHGELDVAKVKALVSSKVPGAVGAGLDAIHRDAVRRCPVDTGALRDSGVIEVRGTTGAVGFTADYAIYVHEDLGAHHRVGEAKFLENALNAAGGEVLAAMAKEMQL